MLKDYVVGLGFDAIKAKLTDVGMHQEVKEALESYIQSQSALNETCSSEEELDFGALAEYIGTKFLEDVEQRLFGATAEIRGNAHRSIVEKANHYARANTNLTQKRVNRFVSDALSILRSFCDRQLPRELRHLSARIADDVTASMEVQHAGLLKQMDSVVRTAIRDEVSVSPLQIDKGLELAKAGQFDQLGGHLTDYFRAISSQHILFPHYGYGPQQNGTAVNVVSVPLTEEAAEKYPPHFKCDGTLTIEGKTVPYPTPQLFQYANNNQLPITLTVSKAHKFLGDVEDPLQHEVADMIGTEWILQPKPFPKAESYSILLNDEVVHDCVLLRVQEIMEDGTIDLSNNEQDIPLTVRVKINPSALRGEFAFGVSSNANRDLLAHLLFLKKFSSGGAVSIRHLKSGRNLLVAKLDPYQSTGDLSLDERIDLLEKLIAIEEYFDDRIALPTRFTTDDVAFVSYLATLVQGKQFHGGWSKYETSMTIEKRTKENLLSFDGKSSSLTYVSSATVTLFGHEHDITLMRTLTSVVLQEPEKVKRKLEVLDEGDDIRLVYLPGDTSANGTFVDQIVSDSFLTMINDIRVQG